jgi:galactonate dehydratase
MNLPNNRPNRRNLLAAGGLAATLAVLNEAAGQDNPAANAADRTSSIRIKRLTSWALGPKVFIKIETNHGIDGWGEVEQLPPTVAVKLIESVFELIQDENPTRIEHLWQKIYRAHRDIRGGAFMLHTIAGIDMALWDITGKLWGVPVYRILGGPTRDRIRMYPTPKAYKVPAGGPKPFSGTPAEIAGLVDAVKEARKRVGPEGTVMFDAHCCLPPPMLLQLAAAIEPYELLFLEEPAVPGNIEVFKRLKEQIRIPIASGERDRTIWEVIPYLENRCIDILQPDCAHTGGITQMRKMAILAEAYYTPIAPHCIASDLGTSASLHCTASVPLFLIHEYNTHPHLEAVARKSWSVGPDGNASLPQGPGLGVEIDEPLLAKMAANPPAWKWPVSTLPDGSVSDY